MQIQMRRKTVGTICGAGSGTRRRLFLKRRDESRLGVADDAPQMEGDITPTLALRTSRPPSRAKGSGGPRESSQPRAADPQTRDTKVTEVEDDSFFPQTSVTVCANLVHLGESCEYLHLPNAILLTRNLIPAFWTKAGLSGGF